MAMSIRIAINGTLGELPYGVLVTFTDRTETQVGIGKEDSDRVQVHLVHLIRTFPG